MKPANNLIRHGIIVLSGTLGANALGYVYQVSMSRLLGVSSYGSMLGLFSIIVLIGIPALVMQTIVAKKIAGYADAHRIDRIRRFVRTLVPIVVALSILVAGTLAFARDGILRFLNVADANGVYLVAFSVLFYITLPILNGVLQGEQRFRPLVISANVDAALRAVLSILFVRAGYGVDGALAAVAIGVMCATIFSAFCVSDLMRAPETPLEPLNYWTNVASSIRLSAGILVISLLASVDVLLVKHYLTAHEAGLFGSLALIGRIVYLIANFVPTIVLPKAAARVSAGHSPVPLLGQAAIVFGLSLSAVLVPMLSVPTLVLRFVAGGAYASAAPLLALYGCAIACLAAAYAAANYKIGVNRLGFVVPVVLIGCAEVVAIAAYHDSLATIIRILAGGHLLILLATIYRIWVYGEGKPTTVAASLAHETIAT